MQELFNRILNTRLPKEGSSADKNGNKLKFAFINLKFTILHNAILDKIQIILISDIFILQMNPETVSYLNFL